MRWRLECQSCQRAKCYGYGVCFACDEDECNYKPFVNTVSTTTTPITDTTTYVSDTSQATFNPTSPTDQP